jgi:hypothetical protein
MWIVNAGAGSIAMVRTPSPQSVDRFPEEQLAVMMATRGRIDDLLELCQR